jgi:hypothetical protein
VDTKDFVLKISCYTLLKSHDRFLNTISKQASRRAGLAAYRRGRLGISPPANYNWL